MQPPLSNLHAIAGALSPARQNSSDLELPERETSSQVAAVLRDVWHDHTLLTNSLKTSCCWHGEREPLSSAVSLRSSQEAGDSRWNPTGA